MLSSFVIVFTICFFNTGATFAQDEMEDVVYFEDGAVVRGKILELNTTRVIIETKGGQKINRSFKEVLTISEEKVKSEVSFIGDTKAIVPKHGFDAAHAQENYQTEIFVNYYRSEDDDDLEMKMHGLSAVIHFTEVNTVGHPLAEAVFLERIGSIEVLVGEQELKVDSTIFEADGPIYGGIATVMKPGLPIAIQATLVKSELEFDAPIDGDIKIDSYGFGIGYFFAHNFLVGVKYSHTERDTDMEIPNFSIVETTKFDDYELAVKFVRELEDGTAFNIEGDFGVSQSDDGTDNESNTIIGISGDYYFNQKISIGGGLEINTGDDKSDEGKTFEIDFKAFVTHIFSINFGLEKFNADNDEGADEESLQFILSARF